VPARVITGNRGLRAGGLSLFIEMFRALLNLILATGFFVGTHFYLSSERQRAFLCRRLGTRRFLVLYSVLATVLLVWMIVAYRSQPLWLLWTGPLWVQYLPLFVMPVAIYLVVEGYMLPNPRRIGGIRAFDTALPAGVLKITRHPTLWGVALWAGSHLCANGDMAAVIFFGGFTVLALAGARHIDQRRRRQFPARFARFAALTSFLPLGAIVEGRAQFTAADIRWWPLVLTLAGYVVLLLVHRPLFGVSPWPV